MALIGVSHFGVGAGIALGSAARTTLRETPDFVDAKRRTRNDKRQ
ncbi:hypothetical protein [Rickettsia australis]|uniref:MFS type sugar transporter n=1 Tax=Rickettsia australis (strain Cutlack) TaxID=1105110 RepID=H8K6Q8_RICAC|nr:hypothetical protein [Rickettsia australis]AFC70951.1 MFS type sugar transporter [Rickettsia australis str. Cutlack]